MRLHDFLMSRSSVQTLLLSSFSLLSFAMCHNSEPVRLSEFVPARICLCRSTSPLRGRPWRLHVVRQGQGGGRGRVTQSLEKDEPITAGLEKRKDTSIKKETA